jgi:hypothetical protein
MSIQSPIGIGLNLKELGNSAEGFSGSAMAVYLLPVK